MDQVGRSYQRRDNCFTWIDDPRRAQELFDSQLTIDWAAMLDEVLTQAHPGNPQMFPRRPMNYYWSADESEWASDVMFKSVERLSALFPRLVRHGMQNLSSRDVMRFLGRKDPYQGGYGAFKGEVVSDLKQRPEGMRLKHRVNRNSIKIYDKQGSVLRVETTLNNTRDFKVYRTAQGQESIAEPAQTAAKPKWRPMRKGVSDMHRRAQVCQAANERYLQAMAAVEDQTPLSQLIEPLCQ